MLRQKKGRCTMKDLEKYISYNEQEDRDKEQYLKFINDFDA